MKNNDLENLTMENIVDENPTMENTIDEKTKCPNCNFIYSPGEVECRNCGIIFAKFNPLAATGEFQRGGGTTPGTPAAPATPGTPAATAATAPYRRKKAKSGKMSSFAISASFIVLLLVCAAYVYFKFIEPRLLVDKFSASLHAYCTAKMDDFHEQAVEEDEEPFRTGKLLIVSPKQRVSLFSEVTGAPLTMHEPEKIHSVWFKIDRKLRASSPADVDTLIRVRKEIGKSFRYGEMKTKVAATHKIFLEFYDWRERTYIGEWTFSPGEGSSFMTEEDFEVMRKATSDETIAEFLQSLEVLK